MDTMVVSMWYIGGQQQAVSSVWRFADECVGIAGIPVICWVQVTVKPRTGAALKYPIGCGGEWSSEADECRDSSAQTTETIEKKLHFAFVIIKILDVKIPRDDCDGY